MKNNSLVNGLSTYNLKIIGIILMFIDHFHEMFSPFGVPDWLDWFGRPVATIFFFVSVIGFSHTHSKRTYMMRLYVCMVLMALLDLFLSLTVHFDKIGLINNIFRDLFVGTLFMAGIDQFKSLKSNQKFKHFLTGLLLCLVPFIFTILAAVISASSLPNMVISTILAFLPAIGTAENGFLVLLVPLLYLAKDNRKIQCLIIALAAIIVYFALPGDTQWLMIFAVIPIWFYNGQKGRGIKYFFYIFYPAHIAGLYLLAALLY
ncbi:TraX family protein [Ligilactobacillus acidipiscis]|uniref:TraX family protein n=1 Tax=Ligilactobacillus acidipiscis TaxID=89059 RepID=UPI0023F6417F|nr:TraX family protein [Ligilactobacillus acidipiscis]WEV56817.1 TraX family protein [Ligilactobacillus acidipiscis]